MKGLILAAGIGKRLEPFTKIIPKALLPIKGRPLIGHIILRFKQAKIKNIGIVVRRKDYSNFKEALKDYKLNFKFIFQDRLLGTAKAVQLARNYIGNERFLLTWCDFLSPYDYRKLIRNHLKYKPLATILINRDKDPSGAAQVLFKGPYITKIVEKPKKRISFYIQSGLLLLEPEIFSALPKVRPQAKGEYHIADALQYLINRGRLVRVLKMDTWKVNINSLDDIREALRKMGA
jgi:glucose-1-phosphate thymidylyltransferase